jgi:hypothetical protein
MGTFPNPTVYMLTLAWRPQFYAASSGYFKVTTCHGKQRFMLESSNSEV